MVCCIDRTKASCWESQVITIHQQLRKKLKERQCEDITQENILLVCQEFNTNPNFQLSVIISLWVWISLECDCLLNGQDKGIMLRVPSYCHTSPNSKEDEGKTMWSINGTQKEKNCCHANKLQHVTQSMLVANVTSIPSPQRPLIGNIKHRCNRYGSLSTWYRMGFLRKA
jgi:hypothetical protein